LGLPLEVLEQSNFEQAAKWYFWFIGLDLLWSLDMAVLLLLNFFEVRLHLLLAFINFSSPIIDSLVAAAQNLKKSRSLNDNISWISLLRRLLPYEAQPIVCPL
jgi:hypothetical protein